ncbi:MAG: esterase/lipase family protein [Halobacteriota archaeon]
MSGRLAPWTLAYRWSLLPMYTAGFTATMAARALAGPDAERVGCHVDCGRPRVDDSCLPWETTDYGGWGGHEYFDTEPGIRRPPVVFVHGNDRDACDWKDHAAYLHDRGFAGDELWAITFGSSTTSHPEMVTQLDDFVGQVRRTTGASTVAVVAHSLGVTGVRYWLDCRARESWVETFVAIAGPNHGVSLCAGPEDADVLGEYSTPCQFVGYRCAENLSHPLGRLNAGRDVPDGIRCFTIRGAFDHYYWRHTDSPTLDEAEENVLLWTDHDGTRRSRRTKSLVYRWLRGDDASSLSA